MTSSSSKLTFDWQYSDLPPLYQQPHVTDDLPTLSAADAAFALAELNEDAATRVDFLLRVRTALRSKFTAEEFRELEIRDDLNWLVRFARSRKYDFDRTLKILDHLYSFRRDKGYTRSKRPPLEHFQIADTGQMVVLEKPDLHGRTVMVVEANKLNIDKLVEHMSMDQMQHVSFYMMLGWLSIDNASIRGLTIVQDLAGMSLMAMLRMGGSQAAMQRAQKERMELFNGGMPIRVKAVLMVDAPLWIRALMSVGSLFMSKKMKKRLHTVARKELADHIDVSILPPHLVHGTAEATPTPQEDDG